MVVISTTRVCDLGGSVVYPPKHIRTLRDRYMEWRIEPSRKWKRVSIISSDANRRTL